MGVVGGVAGAVDDDDAAVRQPLVEGDGRVAEDRQALAAEELEDRLADGAQPVERGGRVRLGLELAQDRAGRGGPDRPDRVGPVGGQVCRRSCRRPRVRNAASAPSLSPAASRSRRRVLDAGRVVARPGRRRRSLVRDDPPDRVGQQRRAERAAPAVRVPEDVDWPASVGRKRLGDRRDVLELALDRIRPVSVPRCPSAATVDRVDRERRAEHRPDDPERRVIGGRPMNEHERRPVT